MDILTLRQQLLSLQDLKYQQFTGSLIPGTDNIIGVRTPALRSLAKNIIKDDPLSYLQAAVPAVDKYHEETILQALVIAQAKLPLPERLEYIRAFLPKVHNWAVCDIFCASLKEAKKQPAVYWSLLQEYLHDSNPFAVRFATVMLLSYYTTDDYTARSLQLLGSITDENYYVKMAVAWAVSIFYIQQPALTLPLLQERSLDKFTHNKAIQKICDSYRVTAEDKAALKLLRQQ